MWRMVRRVCGTRWYGACGAARAVSPPQLKVAAAHSSDCAAPPRSNGRSGARAARQRKWQPPPRRSWRALRAGLAPRCPLHRRRPGRGRTPRALARALARHRCRAPPSRALCVTPRTTERRVPAHSPTPAHPA
eukprot:1103980-Prymnesium_polylepis.2